MKIIKNLSFQNNYLSSMYMPSHYGKMKNKPKMVKKAPKKMTKAKSGGLTAKQKNKLPPALVAAIKKKRKTI